MYLDLIFNSSFLIYELLTPFILSSSFQLLHMRAGGLSP